MIVTPHTKSLLTDRSPPAAPLVSKLSNSKLNHILSCVQTLNSEKCDLLESNQALRQELLATRERTEYLAQEMRSMRSYIQATSVNEKSVNKAILRTQNDELTKQVYSLGNTESQSLAVAL